MNNNARDGKCTIKIFNSFVTYQYFVDVKLNIVIESRHKYTLRLVWKLRLSAEVVHWVCLYQCRNRRTFREVDTIKPARSRTL